MCVVLFPYEAKHEDELTLKENDVIIVLSTDLPDKGWWKGQLHGKIGVFPDNFVKMIPVGEEVSSLNFKLLNRKFHNRYVPVIFTGIIIILMLVVFFFYHL